MSMNDRGQDLEARYAHDQERRFRIEVRRTRLLGLWAAGKLDMSGGEADDYAAELVATDIGSGGPQAVFAKVRRDFDKAQVAQSDHQIQRHMAELLVEAEQQIAAS